MKRNIFIKQCQVCGVDVERSLKTGKSTCFNCKEKRKHINSFKYKKPSKYAKLNELD